MKKAVYRKFGGPEVVRIETGSRPEPKSNEVRIKVHATTVSVADHRVRSLDVPKGLGLMARLALGPFRPRRRVLGMDLAGVIDAVGDKVTRFKPGDEIIAMPGSKFGGHAEYACMSEEAAIAPKPRNMSFEDAVALVFGGHTAVDTFRHIKIKPGDDVLVNGASGAVGSAAVQIAKHHGAVVTGVCSGANREMVLALGADHVIDYTKQDFAKTGARYDVIVECVGNAPFKRVASSIKSGGALLLVIADLRSMLAARRQSRRSGKIVIPIDFKASAKHLAVVAQLAEADALRPVIDRTYDFAEIVGAHRYVDTGRKKGNVVVRVAGDAAA